MCSTLFFFFTFAIETSEGKYVSPFHDIPLIAETEQVKADVLWSLNSEKANICIKLKNPADALMTIFG